MKLPINIVDNPNRHYAVFNGAAFLANFYNKDNISYWITREEWEEFGKSIIDRKCPNLMF